MKKNLEKFWEPSSLAGYGVILSVINQVADVNELGAIGEAMIQTATNGGTSGAILIAALFAGVGAIFKKEGKK